MNGKVGYTSPHTHNPAPSSEYFLIRTTILRGGWRHILSPVLNITSAQSNNSFQPAASEAGLIRTEAGTPQHHSLSSPSCCAKPSHSCLANTLTTHHLVTSHLHFFFQIFSIHNGMSTDACLAAASTRTYLPLESSPR